MEWLTYLPSLHLIENLESIVKRQALYEDSKKSTLKNVYRKSKISADCDSFEE